MSVADSMYVHPDIPEIVNRLVHIQRRPSPLYKLSVNRIKNLINCQTRNKSSVAFEKQTKQLQKGEKKHR